MAIGGIEKVRFVVRDQVVAEHLAGLGQGKRPLRSGALLGAVGAEARGVGLRQALRRLGSTRGFRRFAAAAGGRTGQAGRREFIKVLRLLESCELRELARAVDRALQIGALTVEAIRLLLQDGREDTGEVLSPGRPAASARPCSSAAQLGRLRHAATRGGLP